MGEERGSNDRIEERIGNWLVSPSSSSRRSKGRLSLLHKSKVRWILPSAGMVLKPRTVLLTMHAHILLSCACALDAWSPFPVDAKLVKEGVDRIDEKVLFAFSLINILPSGLFVVVVQVHEQHYALIKTTISHGTLIMSYEIDWNLSQHHGLVKESFCT